MALWDEVVSRYSDDYLTALTNPQQPENTTVTTAKGTLAATDVIADFRIYAGLTFDLTDARHVQVGVEGCIIKLQIRTGQFNAQQLHTEWVNRLNALALVTSRNRLLPITDSVLTVPSESPDGQEVNPDFTRDRFDHLIPGNPTTGDSGNFPND